MHCENTVTDILIADCATFVDSYGERKKRPQYCTAARDGNNGCQIFMAVSYAPQMTVRRLPTLSQSPT